MTARILIAYATRYGSTAEVAQALARRLRERGREVEVRSVGAVASLEGIAAVVVGTPFYFGAPMKPARRFLARHREALERLPVALFALGPVSASEGLEGARGQLDEALAKMPWLAPVGREMFVGAYDPTRLGLFHKLFAALPASPLHGLGARDERDWKAIESWADSLAAAFAP